MKLRRDWFEGKKKKRPSRATPAFCIMGCLTVVALALTLTSLALGWLLTHPGRALGLGDAGVSSQAVVVLSKDPVSFTVGLALLTVFFLLVWVVVALRRM